MKAILTKSQSRFDETARSTHGGVFGSFEHDATFLCSLEGADLTIKIESTNPIFKHPYSEFEIELVLKENPKSSIITEFK